MHIITYTHNQHKHRLYTFNANVTTLDDKLAVAHLTKPDSNPANDWDDAAVTPFIDCAHPYGVIFAGRPDCPALQGYKGVAVDSIVLPNLAAFAASCCVSVPAAVSFVCHVHSTDGLCMVRM